MATGDVVYESAGTEGFWVEYFSKPEIGTEENYAWEAKLKNTDTYGPPAEVVIKGNTLGGVFPPLEGEPTRYKITITEV